jgi:hypothetical protein
MSGRLVPLVDGALEVVLVVRVWAAASWPPRKRIANDLNCIFAFVCVVCRLLLGWFWSWVAKHGSTGDSEIYAGTSGYRDVSDPADGNWQQE